MYDEGSDEVNSRLGAHGRPGGHRWMGARRWLEGQGWLGAPRRLVVAAFVAGAALSAVVTVLAVRSGGGRDHLVTSAASSPSTTVVASVPAPASVSPTPALTAPAVTAVSPPKTVSTLPPTTIALPTASPSAPPITGTVTDTRGNPVAGAYVIGLVSLTVVRTDSAGHFSMPCRITANAISGDRTEPLVAGTWILPVEPSGQGGYGYGHNTTQYPSPPTTPGLGYAFSGGAADAAHAKVVTCDGQPVNFVLRPGGGADIQFLDQAGHPATQFSGPPVDNLYLPGLGDHAALETAPLTTDAHQILQQLGPGLLNLDILYPMACTETAGPQPGPLNVSEVEISSGQTSYITCRETTSSAGAGGTGGSVSPTSTAGT